MGYTSNTAVTFYFDFYWVIAAHSLNSAFPTVLQDKKSTWFFVRHVLHLYRFNIQATVSFYVGQYLQNTLLLQAFGPMAKKPFKQR